MNKLVESLPAKDVNTVLSEDLISDKLAITPVGCYSNKRIKGDSRPIVQDSQLSWFWRSQNLEITVPNDKDRKQMYRENCRAILQRINIKPTRKNLSPFYKKKRSRLQYLVRVLFVCQGKLGKKKIDQIYRSIKIEYELIKFERRTSPPVRYRSQADGWDHHKWPKKLEDAARRLRVCVARIIFGDTFDGKSQLGLPSIFVCAAIRDAYVIWDNAPGLITI